MKIIFLDIDGVLTSCRTGWYNFDIYAVNFLIWVCKLMDAKIVITSTWRRNHGKDFWDKIFPNCIHEDYKTSNGKTRGDEIKKWLDNHPEIEKYLILDDDTDMLEEQKVNFIQTDNMNGLLWEHMDKILEFFDIKDFPHNGGENSIQEFHVDKVMFDLK